LVWMCKNDPIPAFGAQSMIRSPLSRPSSFLLGWRNLYSGIIMIVPLFLHRSSWASERPISAFSDGFLNMTIARGTTLRQGHLGSSRPTLCVASAFPNASGCVDRYAVMDDLERCKNNVVIGWSLLYTDVYMSITSILIDVSSREGLEILNFLNCLKNNVC
jgi:hypothetical protein